MNTPSPFDSLADGAKAALDIANSRYDAVLDRMNARTADDAESGLDEIQSAFRDAQIACKKAEVSLATFKNFVAAWHECRRQRPDATENQLLIAFRDALPTLAFGNRREALNKTLRDRLSASPAE